MTFPAQIMTPDTAAAVEMVPLGAIPAEWNMAWADLASAASEPNPFVERWFIQPAIHNLTTHADDQMLAVWQNTKLVGLLPLTIANRYGRIPVRHVENWVHYHCFLGTPLVRAGFEVMFWEASLKSLDDADWAPNFFHLVGLDPSGPIYASLKKVRRTDVVHHSERALLCSNLNPDAYYEANVRPKKRKEIRRLRARLDELGTVEFEQLGADGDVDDWIAKFLALEASGWKGREGSALNGKSSTKQFFEQAIFGAYRAGKLNMLRLTVDGKPIAMLVNFITPPGSFAFKIAFDEHYARFSPGVLIKIENLKILNRNDIDWTDSCAVEDHPMINSLWAERRAVVRVTVPLAGARRKAMFSAARSLETLSARLRRK
jgi:CelD/BcsL family acetyltransferase involved in cellulose biosynthesis